MPPKPEWSEATLEALQRKGLRNGGARRAVIDLLAEQDCCLTAQEIFDRLRVSDRRVGIASVYRVLELLTSEGCVQRIDLGSGISRYEPVQLRRRPPSPSRLRQLREGGGVRGSASSRLAIHRVEETSGYAVAGHDVVLHGACGDCR